VSPTTSASSSASPARVGQPFEVGHLQLVVRGLDDPLPAPSGAGAAPMGSHLLGVDLEMTNSADTATSVDWAKAVSLLDSSGRHYNLQSAATTAPPAPDATIAPKADQRGVVTFAVPNQVSTYRLVVRGDALGGSDITVPLS
jgi:hypothetical protein